MISEGLTCATWSWGVENRCSGFSDAAKLTGKAYCQQSCFDAGRGYAGANCCNVPSDGKGLKPLFDGKSLDAFEIKSGTATYELKDGVITGTTVVGSPNTFLCTKKKYGDFELQFEVKCHDELNSGVQIRSKLTGDQHGGRVNGPQVEIDAGGANGSLSGYIYGEGAGGWLTPGADRKLHKHFKDGEWNHYKVVAEGPRIQVSVNGVQVSDLTHEGIYKTHPKGLIGLQVHGVGNNGPFTVAWKNLKIREIRK